MEKLFNLTSTFKTLGENDDGGLDIKGFASTNGKDRAGAVSYTHLTLPTTPYV